MSFRIVWRGRFGQESSQLIDELERARLIADSLASRKRKIIRVVDAATNQTVYAASHRPEKRRSGSRTARGSRGSSPSR